MIKLKVVEVNNYSYTLEDVNSQKYFLNIEFYDFEVKAGDYLEVPNLLLEEKNLFAFGPIKSQINKEDIVKVIKPDSKEYFLERYYG